MNMQKKRILIVSKAFDIGGIESALVNMANELQKYYQVELFVYDPTGPMKERLREDVIVLEPSWRLRAIGMPLRAALKSKDLSIILFRIFSTIWTKLVSNRLPIEMAIRRQDQLTGYDLAVSFHQEMGRHTTASGFSRVVDRCVEAKRKVAWLHYDHDVLDLDSGYNMPFYEKMDRIVCVSRSLRDSFAAKYPHFMDKTDFCYNFIDYPALEERSAKRQRISYPSRGIICFSACRLAKEKALVRMIRCTAPVFQAHPEMLWYIAGDGPERGNIESIVSQTGLERQIILLGNQENPYPYMKNADLLLNVSYHEAAPMVFLEAKALGIPVFATKTSSAEELLKDPACAFICENSEEGIYEMFRFLTENPAEIAAAKSALRGCTAGNAQSLSKIESWLTDCVL